MSLVEGQISIFDYLEQKENQKNQITEHQYKTIKKVLEENTGCEIILYESGVV